MKKSLLVGLGLIGSLGILSIAPSTTTAPDALTAARDTHHPAPRMLGEDPLVLPALIHASDYVEGEIIVSPAAGATPPLVASTPISRWPRFWETSCILWSWMKPWPKSAPKLG